MSFYDIFNRCKISATCQQWKSHDMKTVTSDNLMFERPTSSGKSIRREYYKGTLEYCQRAGCHYEKFNGTGPHRVTRVDVATGVEVDIEPAA